MGTTTFSRAYHSASAAEFAREDERRVLGILALRHGFDLEAPQKYAWEYQIRHLRDVMRDLDEGHLFLEFSIPRMGKRVDAVVLYRGIVFAVEYKVRDTDYAAHAIEQVVDYALDLKNFHEGSHRAPVVPVLVATDAPDRAEFVDHWPDDVLRPMLANAGNLAATFRTVADNLDWREFHRDPIDPDAWLSSAYKPTPTIVEAAQALYRGHDVREISRSEAGAENLSRTASYIQRVIDDARFLRRKAICFVTGVPGSGKTLAGLSIANDRMRTNEDEHAVFLSGNGPLVDVLREALANDDVARAKQMGVPLRKAEAQRKARAFIQNIHHFRDEHLHGEVPLEKVVVFDEAQRAWNRQMTSRFMQEKRSLFGFDQSEPELLISVMDRHRDWCVVVCLVGGGQEINTGEAGLGEWLRAIGSHGSGWDVHVSDRLTSDDFLGASDDQVLRDLHATRTPELHLAVSVRSFRAEAVSEFIGAVIDGDAAAARALHGRLSEYPLVLTRSLDAARRWLHRNARGTERIGLVASSNGLRLKPVGLHVRAGIEPPAWFLLPKGDVRSSFALEDVGTEFDVQGLELDWVGMCWDANLRWIDGAWQRWNFRGSRWERVTDPTRGSYLSNAYRVLLTRARQGMVILVPQGDSDDPTRTPAFYDGTFEFLRSCGIPVIGVEAERSIR